MKKLLRFLKDEEGQDVAEYAVLVALIAIGVIVGAAFLSDSVNNVLNDVGSVVDGQIS